MRRFPVGLWAIGIVAFIIPMVVAFAVSRSAHRRTGNTAYVHTEDADLQVAIQTARGSLPHFIADLQKPAPDEKAFAIKVRLTSGAQAEVVYVDHLILNGDVFSGNISSKPALLTTYHQGQPLTVKKADVYDWLIVHEDPDSHQLLNEGGYTDEMLRRRQKGAS